MSATDPATHTTDDSQALARLLEGRWSCRGFLPTPVPRETITQMLDLARHSPSDCNTQPWHVHVMSGAATERFRAALSAHASTTPIQPDFPFPPKYSGVYLKRRMECGLRLYQSVGISFSDRAASAKQTARNFELFGAPHAAILTSDAELGIYGAIDCGVYLQSLLLAAQSLGLGAVPQAALAAYAPFVRQHLQLTSTRLIVCGISFGWPDHRHPANQFRTTRAPVEDSVTWLD